ncbi:hypothetical protein ABIF81_003460 [Bradyrhizobium daqingense]
MRDGSESRQLPVGEMRGEDQRRLAVVADLIEQLDAAFGQFDPAFLRVIAIVVPDVIDMGELGADAAEIVPDAHQDAFDLVRRLLRKGGGEIGAADAVLAQARSDQLYRPREKVRCLDRIEIARGAQHADGGGADQAAAHRFCRLPRAGLHPRRKQRHVSGQAGSRVRISEAFWPPKPNEFDITAVTRASRALLPTTSNRIVGSGVS